MRHMDEVGSDSWASLVRRNRERLQMTQQQLATALNLTRESIGRWESGKLRPSYDAAVAAIRVLGIDREQGLGVAGYGSADGGEPDPYAYVREMGLDPNGRIVRRILSITGISDDLRMKMLRREREMQLRDEQRRLEDLEWVVEQQRREDDERRAS